MKILKLVWSLFRNKEKRKAFFGMVYHELVEGDIAIHAILPLCFIGAIFIVYGLMV